MKSLKLLVFDISGEYGHFRKFNPTSSPLTYAIPTRTALIGILGAILGIEREVSPDSFREGTIPLNELFDRKKTRFAIQILNPIKKVNMGFNMVNTKNFPDYFNLNQVDEKGKIKAAYRRTQIEFELLKNPKFRIFFYHSDSDILGELAERIFERKHHFTPYLGLSQFTTLVEPIEIDTASKTSGEGYDDIISCVNLSDLNSDAPIKFGSDNFYTTDTFPMTMRRDRVITEYAEILIERSGQPIEVKTESYWKTSFGNILFL